MITQSISSTRINMMLVAHLNQLELISGGDKIKKAQI